MSFENYLSYSTVFNGISSEDNLFPLFCVDSMENTRIFASHMRPPKLTNKGMKFLHISDSTELINKEIFIIRRKIDSSGNKINNDYRYVKGIVTGINLDLVYRFSSLTIESENRKEDIYLDRIFLQIPKE